MPATEIKYRLDYLKGIDNYYILRRQVGRVIYLYQKGDFEYLDKDLLDLLKGFNPLNERTIIESIGGMRMNPCSVVSATVTFDFSEGPFSHIRRHVISRATIDNLTYFINSLNDYFNELGIDRFYNVKIDYDLLTVEFKQSGIITTDVYRIFLKRFREIYKEFCDMSGDELKMFARLDNLDDFIKLIEPHLTSSKLIGLPRNQDFLTLIFRDAEGCYQRYDVLSKYVDKSVSIYRHLRSNDSISTSVQVMNRWMLAYVGDLAHFTSVHDNAAVLDKYFIHKGSYGKDDNVIHAIKSDILTNIN